VSTAQSKPGKWEVFRRVSRERFPTARRWSVSRVMPTGTEYLRGSGRGTAKFKSEAAAIAAADKANGAAS